ncbi:uncharacterized protein Tco025E_05834 [Trypanosoma conorhini]|uniref:C2H2-type domain-containing protein n=1 Tax=Trypanosoma conorhini TaxID=83891 RepID=A0A3R7KSI7_9TRYP|nr:uncharacterized protein Tco025E_05834 [Trypanosoma conorhini]RNF14464.1 hypothetical protein Tco025E_05834 [Trypanosoma conorhini]
MFNHHGLSKAQALRAAKGALAAAPERRVIVCLKCSFTMTDREAFRVHVTTKHEKSPPATVTVIHEALAAPRARTPVSSPPPWPPLRERVNQRALDLRRPARDKRYRMQDRLDCHKCPLLPSTHPEGSCDG